MVEPDADIQADESTTTVEADAESVALPAVASVLVLTFLVVLHPTRANTIIKNKKPLIPYATLFKFGSHSYQ